MKTYYKGIDISKNTIKLYNIFGNKLLIVFRYSGTPKQRKKIIDKYIF